MNNTSGYYRDVVPGYICLTTRASADIEISLSSEILFSRARLADARQTMRVDNTMARVQDRPRPNYARNVPSPITKFSSLHRLCQRSTLKWMITGIGTLLANASHLIKAEKARSDFFRWFALLSVNFLFLPDWRSAVF